MITVKLECEKITAERLAYLLNGYVEKGLKIWAHEARIYAVFRLRSLKELKALANELKTNKVKFKFLRLLEDPA